MQFHGELNMREFDRETELYSDDKTTNSGARLNSAYSLFDAHCCHMGTAIKHPMPGRHL